MKSHLSPAQILNAAWPIAVFIGMPGCVEPFNPELTDYENLLVVEARITDQPGPYRVSLSRSRAFDSDLTVPQTGAIVCVTTVEGQCYAFEEVSPGKYQSDSSEWQGSVGSVYTLSIEVNGERYESVSDTLRYTPPMDSIYFEQQERPTDSEEILSGIALFVDTHSANSDSRFYKWNYSEAWEVKAELAYDYNLWRCYDADTSKIVTIASTSQLSDNRVSGLELKFVSTLDSRLKSLYSLLVTQMTISREAFKYWYDIKQTSEMAGTLFDPHHYPIRGNIYNTNDPDDVVLGYFEVVSVVEKRIFISRWDVYGLKFPLPTCYSIADGLPDLAGLPARCTDCTYYGASLTKPDFWPN